MSHCAPSVRPDHIPVGWRRLAARNINSAFETVNADIIHYYLAGRFEIVAVLVFVNRAILADRKRSGRSHITYSGGVDQLDSGDWRFR